MTGELSRPVSLDRLPGVVVVEANADELQALSARLSIPAVLALRCRFRLRREGNVVAADGELEAKVVQTCVVSLDPMEQHVAERFAVRFVPTGTESDDSDPEAPDEVPYHGSWIDLGEAAVEQLALSLDPYPRRLDAELDPALADGGSNPFSALRRLQ